MNKILNTLVATTLFLIVAPQNCLATDFDPLAPPASSVSGAGGNNAGEVNLAIQQSDLPAESKHVDVLYQDGSIILRGTVNSDRDRQDIGNIAQKCGCVSIKNELKISQNTKSTKSTKTPKAKTYTVSH